VLPVFRPVQDLKGMHDPMTKTSGAVKDQAFALEDSNQAFFEGLRPIAPNAWSQLMASNDH